jgi:hypothetical protein
VGRTRAKRLRGFGNAIARPLAVVFVASVIDSFAEASRAQRASAETTPAGVEPSIDPPQPPPIETAAVAAEEAFAPAPTIVEAAEGHAA